MKAEEDFIFFYNSKQTKRMPLLTSLQNRQKSQMKERQKAIELMMEKERIAKENVEKFMIKQEEDRQKLQKNSNGKSK